MIHIANQGDKPKKLLLVKKSLYVRILKEIEYLEAEIDKLERNYYKGKIPSIEFVDTQDNLEYSNKRVKKHIYIKALTKLAYLKSKLNILTSNKNKGEQDEVLLILKLVNLNETQNYEELEKIFGAEASEGITIYNMNDGTEIKKLESILIKQEVRAIPLNVSHAFHSKLMQHMCDEFKAIANDVNFKMDFRGKKRLTKLSF